MANLETIRATLRTCTQQPETMVSADVMAIARELPLSHRVGDPRSLLEIDNLDEMVLAARRGDPDRDLLGTDGCVFLWLGASAYLQPPCVLFLDPLIEADPLRILVAPWDTKGILGHNVLGRRVDADEARRIIEEHSLPPAEGRALLAEVLQWCYSTPGDYVRGETPSRCYPGRNGIPYPAHQVMDRWPAHTFEARVRDEVPLRQRLIAVVLDPLSAWSDRSAPGRIRSFRTWCRRRGIRLRLLVNGESVRDGIIEVCEALLRDRGVL